MAETDLYAGLKTRQSVVWGSGPFDRIAETIADLHSAVAESLHASTGERVLDLGCGTGRVAELVARSGAGVVGVDLSPALIETARERAEKRGLSIDYRVGDAERLELEDASFDAVGSSVGIMFTPSHDAAAAELARVTKPGGRIALASWTPDGGIGELFRMMAPFQSAPPPSSPFDWGDEAKVRGLLGDSFELDFETRVNTVDYPSAEAYWQDMSQNYGPTKSLYEALGERGEELHEAWLALFDDPSYRRGDGFAQERTYLLVTGRRR